MARKESLPEIDLNESHLDDQVNDDLYQYLRDNQKTITAAIGIVVLGVVLFLAMKWRQQEHVAGLQTAYADASASEDFSSFFEDYEGTPLGSLSGLHVARKALDEGDYETAAKLYEKVEAGLTRTPFQGLGQLGRAIAIARSGDTAFAESAIRRVLDDDQAYAAVQANAAYLLGVLGIESGRTELVSEAETRLSGLTGAESYADRLRNLRQQIPVEVTKVESEPEGESDSEVASEPAAEG